MLVRPISPSDEAGYRTILERTSAEDRYCRFFHVVDHFDPDEVQRFVAERDDTLGMLAEEDGEPLGAAHAALLDDRVAELAIVVSENARRRGVGNALLTALIARLRTLGYRELVASALRENKAFAALARRHGFTMQRVDGIALRWVLPLQPLEQASA
jgi:GNAT superfamily N-acetyltransferase